MRFSLFLLVLLASASAGAQDQPEIVIPTQNGLADGVSTYRLADGSRFEITWVQGRKHGPFRKLNKDGAVLEKGIYEQGQREGEWSQFDDAGHKLSTGHYVLGVPHGVHKRYARIGNKRELVESITYVLGLRHGPARGQLEGLAGTAVGAYAWDRPHGTFRTNTAETRFFCGVMKPTVRVQQYLDGKCALPERLNLHMPSSSESASAKRSLSSAQKEAVCHAQETLRTPIRIDGKSPNCPNARVIKEAKESYSRYVRQLYGADDVIREVQATLMIGDYHTALFVQTIRRRGRRGKSARTFGRLDVYEEGLVEWLFDKDEDCDFSVRPKTGRVLAIHPSNKRQTAKPLADFVLAPITNFALSDANILEQYTPRFKHRDSDKLEIELIPRKPHSHLRQVTTEVTIDTLRRSLNLTSVELQLHSGDTIRTEFRKLRSSLRPEKLEANQNTMLVSGWKDFQVTSPKKISCKRQRW